MLGGPCRDRTRRDVGRTDRAETGQGKASKMADRERTRRARAQTEYEQVQTRYWADGRDQTSSRTDGAGTGPDDMPGGSCGGNEATKSASQAATDLASKSADRTGTRRGEQERRPCGSMQGKQYSRPCVNRTSNERTKHQQETLRIAELTRSPNMTLSPHRDKSPKATQV